MSMADILARTYFHRLTARRWLTEDLQETVFEDVPCVLSRAAHTSAPTPGNSEYVLPESLYRVTLFTRPEVVLRLGDRAEVADTVGRVWRGLCSDSVCYPSHCVTVLEVREISHETRPKGESA